VRNGSPKIEMNPTALARPLIAQLLVEVAKREGADAVAHGCTGKGNDQVRFDVAVKALDNRLGVVAPMRVGMGMTREQEIEYAIERGIDIPVTKASPYSVDVNLWGRSVETGVLEDPWVTPPADAYQWTIAPADAPPPVEVTIGFDGGTPVSLDGAAVDPVGLIEGLNALAGGHGVGRIDHIEDRLVGIKSREVYEAPAAVVLHAAHRALEGLTLSKDQLCFGRLLADEVAQATYDGLWFTRLQRQPEDRDEADGAGMVERVPLVVGREGPIVEGARAAAPGDRRSRARSGRARGDPQRVGGRPWRGAH
jgi:argininosuccinate synthase